MEQRAIMEQIEKQSANSVLRSLHHDQEMPRLGNENAGEFIDQQNGQNMREPLLRGIQERQ